MPVAVCGQRRVQDPLKVELQATVTARHGCWQLNSVLLGEILESAENTAFMIFTAQRRAKNSAVYYGESCIFT